MLQILFSRGEVPLFFPNVMDPLVLIKYVKETFLLGVQYKPWTQDGEVTIAEPQA